MNRRLIALALVCMAAIGVYERKTRVLAAGVEPVTYAHDVAPILYSNCAPCHRPGGAAPFPLLSFENAKDRTRQIATVTAKQICDAGLKPAHQKEIARMPLCLRHLREDGS